MSTRLSKAGKLAGLVFALTAAMAMPLSAAARGHGGYYHGNHGGYHGYHGGYHRGGHWDGGRWIGGAIVAGAVLGLVDNALRPAPVYYDPPVVYSRPRTVIYEDGPPVVRERVVERTVYEDPYQTRYIGDDGYDRDDGYDGN